MCGVCGSANFSPSSSASESEFNNIKRLIGIKTKRVDVFVNQHLKHLSGNMKLELGTQKNQTLRESTISIPQSAKTLHAASNKKRASSVSRGRQSLRNDTSVDCLQRSMSENDITDPSGGNANETVSSASDVSMEIRKDEIPSEEWNRRNKKLPILRRSKLSILNPHDVDYKYHSVPLLNNTYRAPRKIRSKIINVTHTCAIPQNKIII